MTTCLRKSCSFGLPCVPFVNCCQFMYLVISLLVLRAGCGIGLYQFLIIAYLFTLQFALTTGLVVKGSGANCNTWTILHSVSFRKYSIEKMQHTNPKDSKVDVKYSCFVSTRHHFKTTNFCHIFFSYHKIWLHSNA